MEGRFWEQLDALVGAADLVIDRPAGSTHPRFPDFVYPYGYGYLAGTTGGDGEGLDVWLGSLPARKLVGVVLTVDAHKQDVELKLLLGCTHDEAQAIVRSHNQGKQAGTLLWRRA